jgi:hypothetical protein
MTGQQQPRANFAAAMASMVFYAHGSVTCPAEQTVGVLDDARASTGA